MRKTKIIIGIITLLIIINLTQAIDWTQYNPSPTPNDFSRVMSLGNGKAFATDINNFFYEYDGSDWLPIANPNSATYNNFIGCSKTSSSHIIYCVYNNLTTNIGMLYQYDTTTDTWTNYILDEHTANEIIQPNIQCTYDKDNYCYYLTNNLDNSSENLYRFTSGGTTNYVQGSSIAWNNYRLSRNSNYKIIKYYYLGGLSPYEWQGFFWTNRAGGVIGAGANLTKFYHNPSTNKGFGTYGNYINFWNSTTSTYMPEPVNYYTATAITQNTIYGANSNTPSLDKIGWYDTIPTSQDNTTNYILDADYDFISGIGWAVGVGGIIYSYNVAPAISYSVIPRIIPETTVYGGQVIFYGQATYTSNIASNLTLEIWDMNFSTLYYTTTLNNVPNGANVELYRINLNSPLWTGYQAGNYTYNLQATLTDNTASTSNSTLWTIINGETINQTHYTAQEYFKTPDDTGFTGIYSVTNYDEDNAYTSIQNGSNIYIASWDTTNPSNIIYNRLTTALNQQSGRNGNPTSISKVSMTQGSDELFIGTNDDLFLYNNASNRKASGLIYDFDKGFGILQNDGINDVTAISSDYAYVCQDGVGLIDNDDIYLYNVSLADFQNQMNMNPCISIKYDGWIYGHRGYNYDVEIWNANQTLTSTIDYTKTISTRAYNDLLDISNNYLTFIAGKDEIRRYDVTNHASPILAGKCFTNQTNEEIESIEAINDNEIIIGVYNPTQGLDILYVCDFANNNTYNAVKGGYVAQYLSGIYGQRAWEITKSNNQGKLLVASGDRLEVFYYEKTNESIVINNPPIIDSYTFTPTPPICLNQGVDIEITAHDPDINNTLYYGVSCAGGGQVTSYGLTNLLNCFYSTAGLKTITIMVKDNYGLLSTASYDTIQVNNCNQTNITTIFFKIIDGNTANPISGVSINLYDNQTIVGTTTTNTNGYADFNGLTPNILYRATFTKDGYATMTQYFYTSNTRYERALQSTTTNGTILIVTVKNSSNSPLEGVLVATLDPVTGSSKYGLTDYTGTVYIFDVIPSTSFIVGAKKEGYETTSVYASIGNGETKNVNIIMGQSRGANGYFPATPRHCADTIKGVWLCGNLSYLGGNACTQDTDCISGRCSFGLSVRECSKFNYTLCDAQGINRGNTCIFKNMTAGIFRTIGDLIIGNFVYVLILVFLIVAGLIISRSLRR